MIVLPQTQGAPHLASFEMWEIMNLNQVGNATATGGKTFAYDSQNELVSMNSGAVQMVYDGDGNRVAKTVNGVVTRYFVDDLNPTGYPQVVEELNGSGAVTRQLSYGLQRIDEQQVLNSTWTPSFYGYDRGPHGQVFVRGVEDGQGSVRQLTNTTLSSENWAPLRLFPRDIYPHPHRPSPTPRDSMDAS